MDNYKPLRMVAGSLHGVCQPSALTIPNYQSVNNQFNGVFFILFAGNFFTEVIENAIYANTGKAAFSGILKNLNMLAFFPADHRRKDNKSCSLPHSLNTVNNLVNGLPADFLAALGTMRNTNTRPQQPQIIIDFRNRTHSGSGVFRCGFLINGNSWRKPVNAIHIRLVHLSQKLTGIGTQTLHITPLTFRINRIKGKA